MRSVPTATVSRLVTYLRILTDLEAADVKRTSSDVLAEEAQVSAFQVRKDLAYFGRFGTRGAGYSVPTLRRELRRILGLTRPWNVAIMGMGRLGQALADYPNFDQYDFILKAAFDNDPDKVGRHIGGVDVFDVAELDARAAEAAIDIAFLTVPAQAAQEAADRLVSAGVHGILNFAPTVITVPPGAFVESVDFVAGLKRLAYYLQGAPGQARVGS
ncbi:MAG: redox-sensing transcriptional repressor Rex [Deinococcales bacterium]